MMKARYRNNLGIFSDLLECCMTEKKISIISRETNLSHYAVIEKLDKLVKLGLVKQVQIELTSEYLQERYKKFARGWKTTQKGFETLKQMRELNEVFSQQGGIYLAS